MGKKARQRRHAEQPKGEGAVGPRQPCPCGSGRRYKACHGASGGVPFVARTFADLPGECDWVAMREIVPAATAPLKLTRDTDRQVLVCSMLPMAAPALVRDDGSVWLGLQVQHTSGDVSADLAGVLLAALDAEPGSEIGPVVPDTSTPRLQDLVDTGQSLEVSVHDGFEFWAADVDDPTGAVAASLESANERATPTVRLPELEAAYWTRMGEREFVRWVLPHDEDRVWDGLARLHASGDDRWGEDGRLIGAFRAHGLLCPVWELPLGTDSEGAAKEGPSLAARLAAAVASGADLSPEERAARNGLANRQITIRQA